MNIRETLEELRKELTVRRPLTKKYTGTGTAIGTFAPGVPFKLLGFRLHMSGVMASAETLTIIAKDGDSAYDTTLLSQDMYATSILDLVEDFGDKEWYFDADDTIVMAFSANTGADTYAAKLIYELIQVEVL